MRLRKQASQRTRVCGEPETKESAPRQPAVEPRLTEGAFCFALGASQTVHIDGRKIFVQAHRGYSGRYPENTLLAFEKAVEAGAEQIELDVAVTGDGTPFILHDPTVDRTTNGTGRLSALTASEVQQLDAGRWKDPAFAGERIPALGAVLDRLNGRVRLNLEIKARGRAQDEWRAATIAAIELIDQRAMWSQVIISSFDAQVLELVLARRPNAFVGLLDWSQEGDQLDFARSLGARGWFVHPKLATAQRVADAHEYGMCVIAGAGNDAATRTASVGARLAAGVDGISTNYPREVVEVLHGGSP